MSSEEQNTDTTENSVEPDKMDGESVAKTDDEKEATVEKTEETPKDARSPTPEYTPPGSQVSLRETEEKKQTDDKEASDADYETITDSSDGSQNMSETEKQAEPVVAKTPEESADKESESKTDDSKQETEQTEQKEQSQDAESANQDSAKTDEEKEAVVNDVKEETKDKDVDAEKKDEEVKKEAVVVAAAAGGAMATEQMEKKIENNEELQQKLESALSNQEAQKEAYQKLVDENAKLQKHHDDMKIKCDEMEGGHLLLAAELETFKKVNEDQQESIKKLENEVKLLKETQGGDEAVKDLQEKLIRLSSEQEEKDKRIHSLEGELDATKEKLKDAESKASRGENSQADAPKSKTCIVM